jgi:hypothetical protein
MMCDLVPLMATMRDMKWADYLVNVKETPKVVCLDYLRVVLLVTLKGESRAVLLADAKVALMAAELVDYLVDESVDM